VRTCVHQELQDHQGLQDRRLTAQMSLMEMGRPRMGVVLVPIVMRWWRWPLRQAELILGQPSHMAQMGSFLPPLDAL